MDEKTEELRDIFMDVAEEETVTERQEESPGTLTAGAPIDDRLEAVIERMQDRYTFDTSLSDAALRTVAKGFYDECSDEAIAEALEIDAETVFRARLHLHLIKEGDREAPIDFAEARRVVTDPDRTLEAVFDLDSAILERVRAVVLAEQEMRQANYRFRDEFDDILGDGDLAEHLTYDVTEDGLEDATEGIEINTSF